MHTRATRAFIAILLKEAIPLDTGDFLRRKISEALERIDLQISSQTWNCFGIPAFLLHTKSTLK